jgi:peptidoglycan-associated lipoprotein
MFSDCNNSKTGGKEGTMKKTLTVLIALAFACSSILLMASCAKKQVKVEEAKPMAPEMKKEMPKVGDTEAYRRAEAERLARLRELEKNQQVLAAIQAFESDHIYFDFDKAELKPEARAILVKKADWLRENPEFSVRIEGHCDERGTNEYNLALGERRASAAWRFLNALGVSGSRVSTISYGEERAAVYGHNENAWSKNRRDEFKVIK